MTASSQRGFLVIAVVFVVLVISVVMAGGSLYSFYGANNNSFLPVQYVASSRYKIEKNQISPTPKVLKLTGDKIIPKTDYFKPHSVYDSNVPTNFTEVITALMCHYNNRGVYPDQLNLIESSCIKPANLKFANQETNKPFSYEVFTTGKGYLLKTTLLTTGEFQGQEFYAMDFENEFLKRKNDAIRYSDFAVLQQLIVSASYGYMLGDIINTGDLCLKIKEKSLPCSGSSLKDNQSLDGTGWIKVNLQPVQGDTQSGLFMSRLPIDPVNDSTHHYVYCANRTQWEMETVLESDQQKDKMKNDGGDDDSKYEIGTNLKLIDKEGNCKY